MSQSPPTAPQPPFEAEPVPVGSPEPPRNPSQVLGIVGFVLSFFVIANIAGLIVSIIAFTRSKKAGFKNGFALAGIVISSIGVTATVVVAGFAATTLVGAAQTCARLGDGVHTVGSATYTCTPTSFYVSYGAAQASAENDQWATANTWYSEGACRADAAWAELNGVGDDLAQLAPAAASASSLFDTAADTFLDRSWPAAIEEDVWALGEAATQLAYSWGQVAESADIDAAKAVVFPDAQAPSEAAERIRAALAEHGQQPLGC